MKKRGLDIEGVLDTGLPRDYSHDLYQQKCSAIFEHVFESYPERDGGVDAAAVCFCGGRLPARHLTQEARLGGNEE